MLNSSQPQIAPPIQGIEIHPQNQRLNNQKLIHGYSSRFDSPQHRREVLGPNLSRLSIRPSPPKLACKEGVGVSSMLKILSHVMTEDAVTL